MTVIPTTSPEPQTCSRCLSLGLPEHGIMPQEPHLILAHEDKTLHCCMDCFNRLYEEVLE